MSNNRDVEQIDLQIKRYYSAWFRVNRVYQEWAARRHMSDTAVFLLEALKTNGGGMSQQALTERLVLPKQSVSFTIGALERAGLVTRMRDDTDRRRNTVALTEQGQVFTASLLKDLYQGEQGAFLRLSEEECSQFCNGFERLADELEQAMLGEKLEP